VLKHALKVNFLAISFLLVPLLIACYSLNINRFCYKDLTFGASRDFIQLALDAELSRGQEFRTVGQRSVEEFRKANADCCETAVASDSLSFASVLFGLVRTNAFLTYMFRDDDGEHKLEVWYLVDSCGHIVSRNQMKD